MNVVNQRVANFIKAFSVFTVFVSLLYMYGYSPENGNNMNASQNWLSSLSKVHLFYFALGAFAMFNLIMNVGISMYKKSKGVDLKSFLFRSKEQKESILMWLSYFLAGINTLIASLLIYLAMIKINEATDASAYLFIPIMGLTILAVSIIGLIQAIIKK